MVLWLCSLVFGFGPFGRLMMGRDGFGLRRGGFRFAQCLGCSVYGEAFDATGGFCWGKI